MRNGGCSSRCAFSWMGVAFLFVGRNVVTGRLFLPALNSTCAEDSGVCGCLCGHAKKFASGARRAHGRQERLRPRLLGRALTARTTLMGGAVCSVIRCCAVTVPVMMRVLRMR